MSRFGDLGLLGGNGVGGSYRGELGWVGNPGLRGELVYFGARVRVPHVSILRLGVCWVVRKLVVGTGRVSVGWNPGLRSETWGTRFRGLLDTGVFHESVISILKQFKNFWKNIQGRPRVSKATRDVSAVK